jgi:hypothetical protein
VYHSECGAGNETQVRRKAWIRRQTRDELISRVRLENGSEYTCTELIVDGADEGFDLFEAKMTWC